MTISVPPALDRTVTSAGTEVELAGDSLEERRMTTAFVFGPARRSSAVNLGVRL